MNNCGHDSLVLFFTLVQMRLNLKRKDVKLYHLLWFRSLHCHIEDQDGSATVKDGSPQESNRFTGFLEGI